jgi:uncharacterized protein (DUF2235 family)
MSLTYCMRSRQSRSLHTLWPTLGLFCLLAVDHLAVAQTAKESTAMPTDYPRRIVLCLDGTWNGTYTRQHRDDKEKTEVVKPSNVLKLCRAVLPRDPVTGREQLVYYDTGIGSLAKYPGLSNRLLSFSDKILGGGWGAGYEANIEDALNFLTLNYQEGDEIFLFGFSRGASTARGVTRFLDWTDGQLPIKRDAFYLPELFRRFVLQKGEGSGAEAVKEIDQRRADENRKLGRNPPSLIQLQPIKVELLGVWDTVMALGSRFRATGKGTSTVSKSFYLDHQPARCVRNARQALAVDEARFDFRPEIWDGSRPDQTLEQRWFAGVHSNVGGGYPDDGLANITFHWILREAETLGLAVDQKFAGFYRPFAKDRLYQSESVLYRALDRLRGRFGRGRRAIEQFAGANLSLDPSVLERMAANPEAHREDGKPVFPNLRQRYRPQNVLLFLACQPDLDSYLRDMEVKAQAEERRLQEPGREHRPANRMLPQDARDMIARLRPKCATVAATAQSR